MSLINQMLRDLDQREASALERNGLAAQVRALPREKRFPWASVLPIAIGAALAAFGAWLAYDATVSSPPAPTPASAPTIPPQTALAMPVLVVPMPTEPVESVAPPVSAPVEEPLHMERKLSRPLRTDPLPKRETASPAAPLAVAAAVAVPPPPTPPAQIDKRPLAPAANTAEAEYRKALAAYRQGRQNEAVEGFQAALRLDPRHVAARQALLSQLLEQRRWPEAQATAAEGLALVPAQPGWAMILARLQVEQGQVAEAERTMATYAAAGERSPDYQAFHGLLLEKLQRPQEARAAFTRARDLGNLPPELAAAVDQRLR